MTVSEYKHKFLYTSSEKMSELPITNGQFIFCHDKGTLYFDFDDVRKQYGEVTVVSNDTERLAETPLDKSFYYVEDTKSLWFYRNETWIQISQDWANIVTTLQNKTVGMIEYEPRADITTVEQFIALDSGNYYLTKFSGMMYDVNEEFLMTLYANSRIQIEKGTDSTNIHLITNDGEVIFYNVTTFEQVNGDITFTMLKCESYEYNDFTHVNERIDEVLSKSKMVVTISRAQTLALNPANNWVADKTFTEIKEFIDNGGNPILYFDDANETILNLSTARPDAIMFSAMLIITPTAVTPLSDTITVPDFVEMRVEINRQDAVLVQVNQVAVADIVIDRLSTIDKTVAGAINEINAKIVQSDYEQNDSTQMDYIKNRPFHDAVLETNYVEGDTLNIDTDNIYSLINVEPFYLVSSTTPTLEDVNKGWSAVTTIDGTITGTEYLQVSENLIMFNNQIPAIIALTDNIEFSGIVFPKKGIYAAPTVTSITITDFPGFDVYNVIEPKKTLDKKFLPEEYATIEFVNDKFPTKGSVLTQLSTLTYRNHVYSVNMEDGSRIFAWILTDKGLWCITSFTVFSTGYKKLRINTTDCTIESLNTQSDQDVPTFKATLYNINTGRMITSQSAYNVTRLEIGKFSKISGNNFDIYIDDSFQYVKPIHSFDEIQSDWNQNDENASDYIRNRTHYTLEPEEFTLIDEQTIEFIHTSTLSGESIEPNPSYDNYVMSSDIIPFSDEAKQTELVEGQKYTVLWDGVEYPDIICEYNNVYGYFSIGASITANDDNELTGYDFSVYPFRFDSSNGLIETFELEQESAGCNLYISTSEFDTEITSVSHTFKITSYFSDVVQLPEKYISYKPGLKVEGRIYTDGEAEHGAEIFNNYTGNIAIGKYSHAEGSETTASGSNSHTEGLGTTASGYCSHAEGQNTNASGGSAHAEGVSTTASGLFSHAEGNHAIASGQCSHAEGNNTIASGNHSHAEGTRTNASGHNQHVQGKYNIIDTENKFAHIVGNGNALKCSNAHTLDWNGNAEYAGDVKANAYTDTPISLVNISTLITALIGEDANKTIRNIANEVLAEQLIEENADESLNSIKELAAWFQQHPKEAASMNAAIQALQNLVGTLPEGVVSTTIVDYIKESIDANNSAMTFKLDEEGVLYI